MRGEKKQPEVKLGSVYVATMLYKGYDWWLLILYINRFPAC